MLKKTLILFFLMVMGFYYGPILLSQKAKPISSTQNIEQKEEALVTDALVYPMPVSGFEHYLAQPIASFQTRYGDPSRIAEIPNAASWWVYQDDPARFLQLEVKESNVQSIYVMGEEVNTGPFRIGMTRANILDETQLASEFHFSMSEERYILQLSKEQQDYFPLIQYENDTFLMIFLHPETEKVYGLRYLTAEALIRLGFYQIQTEPDAVVGNSAATRSMTEAQQKEKELQLVSFINLVRLQKGLESLQPSEELMGKATTLAQELSTQELAFSEFPSLENNDRFDGFFHVSGYQAHDIPVQFSTILLNNKNRSLLMNETYSEIAVQTIEDDLLFLVQ